MFVSNVEASWKLIFVSFDNVCSQHSFFGSATNGNIMNPLTNMVNTFILAVGYITFENEKIRHISKYGPRIEFQIRW